VSGADAGLAAGLASATMAFDGGELATRPTGPGWDRGGRRTIVIATGPGQRGTFVA